MAYNTTTFGLKLADPATIQAFETSVVNDNLQKLSDQAVISAADHATTIGKFMNLQKIVQPAAGGDITFPAAGTPVVYASVHFNAAPYARKISFHAQALVTAGSADLYVGVGPSGSYATTERGRAVAGNSAIVEHKEILAANTAQDYQILVANSTAVNSSIARDNSLTFCWVEDVSL